MYHAGNLGFCLGFDWQTVASVAHGDHSVLQIASGCAVVDHVVHLGANPSFMPRMERRMERSVLLASSAISSSARMQRLISS